MKRANQQYFCYLGKLMRNQDHLRRKFLVILKTAILCSSVAFLNHFPDQVSCIALSISCRQEEKANCIQWEAHGDYLGETKTS